LLFELHKLVTFKLADKNTVYQHFKELALQKAQAAAVKYTSLFLLLQYLPVQNDVRLPAEERIKIPNIILSSGKRNVSPLTFQSC